MVDFYLIHWPLPQHGLYVDTWRAFIELRKQGRVRSIGVSNFTAQQLERIVNETGVVPALKGNSSSLENKIATEAWSPLGRGKSLNHPTIRAIANRHGRTPAQVVLRWNIESGVVVRYPGR